jgi:hypothetical protein
MIATRFPVRLYLALSGARKQRTSTLKKLLTIAAKQMIFRPQIDQNVAWIVDTIGRSAQGGVDIILFPECAVTGYNCDFTKIRRSEIDAALAKLAAAARGFRCNVVVGSPTFAGRKLFNSLLVFDLAVSKIFLVLIVGERLPAYLVRLAGKDWIHYSPIRKKHGSMDRPPRCAEGLGGLYRANGAAGSAQPDNGNRPVLWDQWARARLLRAGRAERRIDHRKERWQFAGAAASGWHARFKL